MTDRRLHVCVLAPPTVATPEDLAHAPPGADLYELRLDLLGVRTSDDVTAWLVACRARHLSVMATVRSTAHGGRFDGTAREAAALLEAAARAGAAWLDAEPDARAALAPVPAEVEVLVSVHGDLPAPPQTPRKIARPVASTAALDALAAEADRDTTLVPYGPFGAARGALVTDATGTTFLYGSPDPVVAGQPSLEILLRDLRAGEVGPRAELYGLIGAPPGTSPSPAMHNAVFRAAGRDALYLPLPGLVLEDALACPRLRGLSVTMPAKRQACALATSHTPEVLATGVANTLVRTAGGWHAQNTDATGLHTLLAPAAPGATAVVYGAGATARSALWALRAHGYDVRIAARHSEAGRALASESGCEHAGDATSRRASDAVLVNATPAGARDPLPDFLRDMPLADLHVLDAPYRRVDRPTELATRATAGGATLTDGFAWLRAQARGQVAAFGTDVGDLDRLLTWAVDPPRSLWLVGARGVGKSTVGRLVARTLGRPFVDLDDEVARRTGTTSAGWIARSWDALREVEHEALATLACRRGCVVATGGGVVDGPTTWDALDGDPLVVWLDAPPATVLARRLAAPGERPSWPGTTSLAEEVDVLDALRRTAYEHASHLRVDASGAADDVAGAVTRAWTDAGAST